VSATVLIAVIASAFLHASWNAILKREGEPEVVATGVFAVCAVLAIAAALVVGRGFPDTASFVWSAASGVCEAGYILTLARALSRAPLGVVYTVSRGGSLVGVWPISILFLGEQATAPALVGAGLVLLGLIATGVGQDRAGKTDPGGIFWATISAANIAGYHIFYKEALSHGGAPTAIFAVSMAVAVPLNLERIGAARRRRLLPLLRERAFPLGSAGVLSCASFLVFLVGLAHAGAGAVLTLRNTSILFAQLLALAIGERPTRIRFIGALIVAAGSILIGL
jgi:drug/metabolite transporter (DMT)-like permease